MGTYANTEFWVEALTSPTALGLVPDKPSAPGESARDRACRLGPTWLWLATSWSVISTESANLHTHTYGLEVEESFAKWSDNGKLASPHKRNPIRQRAGSATGAPCLRSYPWPPWERGPSGIERDISPQLVSE